MAKNKSEYNVNSPSDTRNKDTFDIKDLESFTLFDPSKDDKGTITEQPGNYAILLRQGSKLPDIGVPYIPCLINYKGEVYELIDPILNLEEYPEHSLNIPFRKTLKNIRKPDKILEPQ